MTTPPRPPLPRRTFLQSALAVGGAAWISPAAHGSAAERPTSADAHTEFPRRRVQVEGVTLSVIDVGSGPAVLLLHGFPGSAMDWRHQIPALVADGYRVVACDLLGLGRSDRPQEPEHYTVVRDAARTLALLDAMRLQRVRIASHDRGAGLGWNLAAHHPERVEQLVALTVGHSNAARAPSIEQRERSWYMLLFQFSAAEEMLREDDWHLFRTWLRNHPETGTWIRALSPEGALTAGLGWYRANRRPGGPPAPQLPDVTIPGLGLWATEDAYLLPEYMLESYRYVRAPWRTERIDGASHFLMLDQPERVNRLVLDFFRNGPGGRNR